MILHKIATPGLAVNTYVIVDPQTKNAAVIDPVRDIKPILQLIEKEGLNVTSILETHVHADFVSGSKELKHHLNDGPGIYCSGTGGHAWIPEYADFIIKNEESILLGGIRIVAWQTPGHTPEHVMWLIYNDNIDAEEPIAALTGDFLFIGSVGRPDLLGEREVLQLAEKLYDSVFRVLPDLPDSLEIYPAHGAGSFCGKSIGKETSSTLGRERENNPYLKEIPREEWINNVLKDMPKAPRYFSLMKKVNVTGPSLLIDLPSVDEFSLQELIEKQKEGLAILDVRSKEDFAKSHIKRSLNLGVEGSFLPWAPEILSYDTPILVVAKDPITLDQAISKLRIVGLDNIVGYILWNSKHESELAKTKELQESFPLLTPQAVGEKIRRDEKQPFVLDVRSPQEWTGGHIPGSINIPLRDLQTDLEKVPKDPDVNIVTVCGSGYRSSTAASMLKNAGYEDVSNMQGGMNEWNRLQLPISRAKRS